MIRHKILNSLKNPAWLSFLWLGISLGVAGIATPVRFATASLSREVAAEVGRNVFVALNRVELALLVALLILVRVTGRARQCLLAGAGLAAIVIVQSAWLLPELAVRADLIAAGGSPPETAAHSLYGALEIAKYALLLWIGFGALGDASGRSGAR
jgi:hypothetical protein